jgi:hypothetical protein
MGYSGFVIIARTDGIRLDELACVDDLLVAVTDNVRADGWRIGFLGLIDEDISPTALASELALETAAPAIALSVFDSDCAYATAADPEGNTVEFYLDENNAQDLIDDDHFEPLNGHAMPGLLAWAENADLHPHHDLLPAALQESPGAFGDGIFTLATALGIASLPD